MNKTLSVEFMMLWM